MIKKSPQPEAAQQMAVTDDVRKLIRRIKESALGRKDGESSESSKSPNSALLYASSEEEDERALSDADYEPE